MRSAAVLVLLPPSEGKATAGEGDPLDLDALAQPPLKQARRAVLAALVKLCTVRPGSKAEQNALAALRLSPGQVGELARNAALRTAPALPAADLYTGVLYDALGLADLDAAARGRADRALRVFSGLWGVLRLDDRVPPYRCAMGVKLPATGALGAYWRTRLDPVLTAEAAEDGGLVLDLRSAAYAAAWRPSGPTATRTATVRVLHERDGRRTVVSHFNKATKGRIVRDLLLGGAEPRTPAELADVLRELKYTVEAEPPARLHTPWQLDVVVGEL